MALPQLTPSDAGANARKKLNDGLAAVDSIAALLAALNDLLNASIVSAPPSLRRPADGLTAYTFATSLSALSGEASALPPLASGRIAQNASGAVIRVNGLGIVAAREAIPLEAGRILAVRATVSRFANASDPNNDSVRIGVAWLDQAKQVIGSLPGIIANLPDLLTTSEQQSRTGYISTIDGAGVTLAAPPGAAFVRPLVQIFGADGLTDVGVLSWLDFTDQRIPEGVPPSLVADVAALKTQVSAASVAQSLIARDLGVIPLTSVVQAGFNTISAEIVQNAATVGLTGTGTYFKGKFTPTANNTGACTLAIGASPRLPLNRGDGTPLQKDDLQLGKSVEVEKRADNTYRITSETYPRRTLDGNVKPTAASIIQSLGNAPSWDTGRSPFTVTGGNDTGKWYAAQPTAGRDEMLRCINTDTTIDLTWMVTNTPVRVYAAARTRVFAGDNPTGDPGKALFLGQGTGPSNLCVMPAGSYAVFRSCGNNPIRIAVESASTAFTYSVAARPPMNLSLLLIGQSHVEIAATCGGIGGFAREMMSNEIGGTMSAPDRRSIYYIPAAEGGTTATKSSASRDNNWWDETTGLPGPVLLRCLARIDADVEAGQPYPQAAVHAQGDGDGFSIQQGVTKIEDFQANWLNVWNYLRAYNPKGLATPPMQGLKILIFPPGSVDNNFTTTAMLAIRNAYRELIARPENASWLAYGGEMYDLPRTRGQLHLADAGSAVFGMRWALAFKRFILGHAIDRGPILKSATYYTARKVLEVVIAGEGPAGESPWSIPHPGATDDAVNPYGFQIVKPPIVGPGSNAPIKVLGASCVDNSASGKRRLTFYLTLESDPTGAFFYTVADWAQHVWARTYPMSEVQEGVAASEPIWFQALPITIAP